MNGSNNHFNTVRIMPNVIDQQTIDILNNVYESLTKQSILGHGDGWVHLAAFGAKLSKSGISFRDYGYQKLKEFILNAHAFTVYSDEHQTPPVVYIRKASKKLNHPTGRTTRAKIPASSQIDNPQLFDELKDFYKELIDDAEMSWPEVVGFYEVDKEGHYQFSDIRDTLFNEHKYPFKESPDEDREIIVRLNGPINTLRLNTYYKFNWKVSRADNKRGYVLDFDDTKEVRRIDPEELTRSLHELWDDRKHGSAMNTAMETISSELMASSDGTFIYELLQNANDYPKKENGKNVPVEVEFHMTDKYLVCRHTGTTFSPRDVASICSIGSGSKTKNKNAIGYKGIGFKTVFHAHDWVYVKTGNYSFRFDKKHEREGRPFQIMPVWTTSEELSGTDTTIAELVKNGEREFGVQTVMKPRKPDYLYGMDKSTESEKSHEYVLRDMFKDIRDIIFIPNIKTVRVYFPGEEPTICSKGESLDWVISDPLIHTLDPTQRKAIIDECEQHPERRIPPKYKSFDDTYVSFAAKKDGNSILAVKDATVNCYLPTKAEFGFPFLMNTDMVPSGDRNQLKTDVKFNQLFAQIAGQKFVTWLNQLLINGYEPGSVFDLIPDFNAAKEGVGKQYREFIECFESGFNEAIKVIPIIPVEGSNELQLPCNVLRDVTGFSTKGIIGQDQFRKYTNHESLYLPLASLSDNERLIRILSDCAECVKFRDPNLVSLFSSDCFKPILLDESTNARVLEFILDYTYKANYKSLSLFINEVTKTLSTSEALYLDIDEERRLLCAFENQLSFLSLKTRETLKKDSSETNDYIEKLKFFKWAEFKAYASVIKPLFETSTCKEANVSLLKDEKSNLDMFRFIVKHQIKAEVIKSFPLLLCDGLWGKLSDTCFFHSKDAVDSRCEHWLEKDWYSVLSSKYIPSDPTSAKTVKAFFNLLGVQEYSKKALYDRVIKGNNDHIERINLKCNGDFAAFSEMVSFLYQLKDEKDIGSFNHFTLPVTGKDGTKTQKTGRDNKIFWYDPDKKESFSSLLNKEWIAEGWAYVLDSRSQSIIKTNNLDDVRKFFVDKFTVKEPTTKNFCKHVVEKNLAEILKSISPDYSAQDESPEDIVKRESTKRTNLDFFKFVCENYALVFADGYNPFHDCGYPFFLSNNKTKEQPGKYYKYSLQAVEAASQEWLPESLIGVIDEGYDIISSPLYIATLLYTNLKVQDFSFSSFLKEDVSSNKAAVVKAMGSFEKNVAFHCFFKEKRSSFSLEDLEILKNFPVYLMADNGPVMSPVSNGHHIINQEVEKLVVAGYGTASTMDMIPSEYFGEKNADSAYWIDTLGNKEFSFKEIADWMTTKVSTTILQKTQTLEDNVSFWRLVKAIPGASNKDNQKSLRTLRVFPIHNRCIKDNETRITSLATSTQSYVSDSYFFGGGGIEYMLKEYADGSCIILGDYLEDNEEETVLSWRKFWESAGFLSSNEELVMNTIIPNLDKEENQNAKVPLLLFQNKDIIEKHLSDASDMEKRERLILDLNNLFIQTYGGMRLISDAFFLQKNEYAPFDEPMPYMKLLSQVIDYSDEQYTFFMSIGNRAGSKKIADQSGWRIEKIKQFSLLQDQTFSDTQAELPLDLKAIHFKFIEDLAKWWTPMNSLDYGSYFRKIKLYDRQERLCSANTLTEGKAYTPYCDFESCGIREPLNYISDKYSGFKGILPLLNDMGIHHTFWKEDIPLLINKTFATYFWNQYVADSDARTRIAEFIDEGEFRGKKCVPTVDGVKAAEELYNTFEGSGKTDLSSYVNRLKDGDKYRPEGIFESFQDKSDNSIYLNPISLLDFVDKLSKEHCFEYLLNSSVKNTDKRRFVLNQLYVYFGQNAIAEDDITTYRSSENANWLNGQKEAAHVTSLYAIGRQPEDRFYLRHFGNSPHIISNDTISDDDNAFETICDKILRIKVLHGGKDNSDFVTHPSQDNIDETERIREILNRKSLLLSTIIDAPEGTDWKNAYDNYINCIQTLHFTKCSSISIECTENREICKSNVDAFHFDEGTNTFFYLKDWQDKFVFDSMWRNLVEVLGIPGEDEMTIKRILDKDLANSEVDALIKEYCRDFFDNEEFISLLSQSYPDTSQRLNIKPASAEEDEDPKKLVGFSTSREAVPQKSESTEDGRAGAPTSSHDIKSSGEKIVEDTPDEAEQMDRDHAKDYNKSLNVEKQDSHPDGGSPSENPTKTVTTVDVRPAETKAADRQREEDASPSATGAPANDEDSVKQQTVRARDRKYVSRREPEDGEDWAERYKPKTQPGDSFDPTEWKKSVEPSELKVADLREDELEDIRSIIDNSMSEEKVVSEHFLVRYRLYNFLSREGIDVGDKKEFLSKRIDAISSDKGYIYARSARGGLLFVSSFLWGKLKTRTGRLCMFYGNEADDFVLVETIEKLVEFVGNDNIIVQVKGVNKLQTMESVFNGQLIEKAHILIRVRSNKRYNSLFTYDNDSDNMGF